MGVGGRGTVYTSGANKPTEDAAVSEIFNPRTPATAFDHSTTIVAVLELSGKNWLFGAIAPGVKRRAKRSFAARDVVGVTKALEQTKAQAEKAGFAVTRTVLAYEAGRDGFWIALALAQRAPPPRPLSSGEGPDNNLKIWRHEMPKNLLDKPDPIRARR